MADIVVCVTKAMEAEQDHVASKPDWVFFRPVFRLPRNLEEGDSVYHVQRERIRFKRQVIGFLDGPLTCQTTGRTWSGFHVLMSGLAGPVEEEYQDIKCRHFRGFRYLSTVLQAASGGGHPVSPLRRSSSWIK